MEHRTSSTEDKVARGFGVTPAGNAALGQLAGGREGPVPNPWKECRVSEESWFLPSMWVIQAGPSLRGTLWGALCRGPWQNPSVLQSLLHLPFKPSHIVIHHPPYSQPHLPPSQHPAYRPTSFFFLCIFLQLPAVLKPNRFFQVSGQSVDPKT